MSKLRDGYRRQHSHEWLIEIKTGQASTKGRMKNLLGALCTALAIIALIFGLAFLMEHEAHGWVGLSVAAFVVSFVVTFITTNK